jgi:hypothetical protein
MEWVFAILKGPALYGFVALGLTKLGVFLKNKDANTIGADDAMGDVCIALAPAIAAIEGSNENAKRKALKVARDTIDGYLRS